MTLFLLLSLSLSQVRGDTLGSAGTSLSREEPVQLYDEGTRLNRVTRLNFTGSGVSCSASNGTGTWARPLSVALIDEAIDFADAEAEKAKALGHKEQGGNVRLLNATRYLQKKKKSLPQHVARAAIIHRKAQKP